MFRDVAQIKRLTDILSFQKATGNADVRGSITASGPRPYMWMRRRAEMTVALLDVHIMTYLVCQVPNWRCVTFRILQGPVS